MLKDDAIEAKPIVDSTLDALIAWAPTRGRPGADLRSIIGYTKAHSLALLQYDAIDIPLIRCFDAAFTTGINYYEIETVRRVAAEQDAVTVGGIMAKDTLIELSLATAGFILSSSTFTSRQDVDQIRGAINASFEEMEVELADQMDSMTWRAVLHTHAAITMHLTETARPLPRMLAYRFNMIMPSVVLAHRLYADAGRADELRDENKIVHPAFCLRSGRALSA